MARRATPALLLAAAALADAAGVHRFALYALLVAIPVVAALALTAYGELLDADGTVRLTRRVQGVLWTIVLALVLFATAARAPAIHEEDVPALGVSALAAALLVLALEALAALASERAPT